MDNLIGKRVIWTSATGPKEGTATRKCQQYPMSFIWIMGDDGTEYYVFKHLVTAKA